MKILTLGDIHGKIIWKEIIEKETPDLTIFLGDYVSTHKSETAKLQVSNLMDILEYKSNNPNKVILHRGNHDTQHLGYPWANASGFDPEVYKLMQPLKQTFLDNTQWIHTIQIEDKTILFSHAGVSNIWFNNLKKDTGITTLEEINTLEPSDWFGFIPNSFSDFCGTSKTQPCTWIRPQTLIENMLPNIVQVVGHTPVKNSCVNISIEVRKAYKDLEHVPYLWLCDALDNRSYLIIEDGNFISKTI